MRIDHVIYGTADLGVVATWFADEFGLGVVRGGRHDGLGTHNRLVPLGDGEAPARNKNDNPERTNAMRNLSNRRLGKPYISQRRPQSAPES